MLLLRRCRAAVLLWLVVASAVPAVGSEASLPPLAGELSGEFTPLIFAGAPALQWKLALRAGAAAEERVADFTVEGPGLRARGEAHLTATTEGRWRLTMAEVDLARWFSLVATKYFPDLTSLSVEGTLALSGEGALHAGKLTGRVTLDLREGVVRDPAKELTVQGLALSGSLGQLPALTSDGTFKVTFHEATVAGVTARNAVVEFSIDANETVHVARATASMFEGGVEMTPFAFSLAKPEVKGDVHFNGIEIARLKELLPPVLSDATGRVSGRMAVSWSAAEGLSPGTGRLQIDPGASAQIRLAPRPGFLTSRVPERIELLPKSFGPIGRLFSPRNPAVDTLRAIEMGELALEVNALDIGLRPEGDPAGRTARVVVTARPAAKNSAVESVRFEVNVSGPLADLLRLGLEGRIQVRAN